jgi:hypothetical protein
MNEKTTQPLADLGRLIQRVSMPAASGMDGLEARLVDVQDVPRTGEVRFYAVRGEVRERLSTAAALAMLRAHIPQRPIHTLSNIELIVEVEVLRTEVARMRAVYEAAKAWLAADDHDAPDADIPNTEQLLILEIERAEIAEKGSL